MGLTTFTAKIYDCFYSICRRTCIAPTGSTTIKHDQKLQHIFWFIDTGTGQPFPDNLSSTQ